ncbi:MAG: DUF748 domain-containing protein [Gammaproteobacteria bacterium]|nr:DUF748 domain-containing protein [Gammaproteobacteria bacterium]
MDEESQKETTGLPVWRWRLWKVLGLVVLVFTLLLVAMPYGIGYLLKQQLIEAGASEVNLQDVDFNLFAGHLAVKNLRITTPELPGVELAHAEVDMGWRAILEKRLLIETLAIRDTEIQVERLPDGSLIVTGLKVFDLSEADQAESSTAVDEAGFFSGVGINQLQLSNVSIHYREPGLNTRLKIEQMVLNNIHSWQNDLAGGLTFAGSLDGAPVNFESDLQLFGESRSVSMDVDIEGLELAGYKKYLPQSERLEGKLILKGILHGQMEDEFFTLVQEGDIGLSGLVMTPGQDQLSLAGLSWKGKVMVALPLTGEMQSLHLKVKGELGMTNLSSQLAGPDLQVNVAAIAWQGDVEQLGTSLDDIKIDGGLDISEAAVEMKGETPLSVSAKDIALSQLQLRGIDQLQLGSSQLGSIQFTMMGGLPLEGAFGSLQLDGLKLAGNQLELLDRLQLEQARLALSGQVPLVINVAQAVLATLKAQGEESLSATGLTLQNLDIDLAGDQSIKGQLAELEAQGLVWSGGSEGGLESLSMKELHAEIAAAQGAKVVLQKLTVGQLTSRDEKIEIGNGLLESGEVDSSDGTLRLAQFDRLQLDKFEADTEGDLSLNALQLREWILFAPVIDSGKAERESALLGAKLFTLTPASFKGGNRLELGEVLVSDAHGSLTRLESGELAQLQGLDLSSGESSEPLDGATDSDRGQHAEIGGDSVAPMTIAIDHFQLQGKNLFELEDHKQKPAFKAPVYISKLEVVNLDSGDSSKQTTFDLQGETDTQGLFSAKGKAQFFAVEPASELSMEFEGATLRKYSSYLISAMGYQVDSGKMDAKLVLETDGKGGIKGNVDALMRHLDLSVADAEKAATQGTVNGMGLGAALALMRDKKNNIELSLPISGKTNDLDVGIDKVIASLVGKAVITGAMTYVKVALFPYGTALLLVDELGKVRLKPIEYPAGEIEPTEESLPYLEKVAGMLTDRPEMSLELCVFVTAEDGAVLAEEQVGTDAEIEDRAEPKEEADKEKEESKPMISEAELLSFASQRGEHLEQLLKDRYRVPANRLLTCRPEIDSSSGAKSRVDLSM